MKRELSRKITEALDICIEEPQLAIELGKQILQEGEKNNSYYEMGQGNYVIANSMFYSGKREDMLKHAMAALTYFQSLGNYSMMVKCHNLLGITYAAREEHDIALQSYQEALKIKKEHHVRLTKGLLENNIADEYACLGDLKTAIKIFEKILARQCRIKKPVLSLSAVVAYNLADAYSRLGDQEKAFQCIDKCGEFVAMMHEEYEEFTYHGLRARIHYEAGDIEKGNEYSDKITQYMKENDNVVIESLNCIEKIALLQIECGEYDRADFYGDYLWDYAQNTRFSRDIIRACRVQAKYFDKIGNIEKSIYYYRLIDKEYNRLEIEERQTKLKLALEREHAMAKMEELRRNMERQTLLNSKDPLTGLLNRGAFTTILDSYIEKAKDMRMYLGGIFIDVDYFKEYNDTYGHIKGDECLIKLAKVCLDEEKKCDHVHFARYGGDEFFGMLLGYDEKEVERIACSIASRVREMNVAHVANPLCSRVTISMGIMSAKLDESVSLIEVVNKLDRALYESKKGGRNCIHKLIFEKANLNDVIEIKKVEY